MRDLRPPIEAITLTDAGPGQVQLHPALSKLFERRESFQAIVADCLLWFDGFSAAYAHLEPGDRPRIPDRDQLRELNGSFQDLLGQEGKPPPI